MAKKKLLVADDSHLMHRIYAEAVGEEYELLHSFDGVETLLLAVNQTPDLILLDIMMPLLDGRTICKKLKEFPATKQIKIIMVTAKDTQSDRLVGFEVGADDYLEKPCTTELLLSRIRKQLQ